MKSHCTPDNEIHKRTIEQARAGYHNGQEIIRFIDTKSSFITGASTVSIGFVLNALKEYIQLPSALRNNFDSCPVMIFWITSLAIISLFVGVLCLWQSIMSLVGRPPRSPDYRPTILFPFYVGSQAERLQCDKIVSGMTEEDIAQEFQTQILSLGIIVRRKFVRHRWAGWLLLFQLTAITAAGILVLICLYSSYAHN